MGSMIEDYKNKIYKATSTKIRTPDNGLLVQVCWFSPSYKRLTPSHGFCGWQGGFDCVTKMLPCHCDYRWWTNYLSLWKFLLIVKFYRISCLGNQFRYFYCCACQLCVRLYVGTILIEFLTNRFDYGAPMAISLQCDCMNVSSMLVHHPGKG